MPSDRLARGGISTAAHCLSAVSGGRPSILHPRQVRLRLPKRSKESVWAKGFRLPLLLLSVFGLSSAQSPPSIGLTAYPVTAGVEPYGITLGPDGALWFTGSASIGRITTDGSITYFSKGLTAESEPNGITAGPDGNLWFTEYSSPNIGRITTSGVITEFPVTQFPGLGTPLGGITTGSDGNLWFTATPCIGQITTSGAITAFCGPAGLPGGFGAPQWVTAGPDSDLWFTTVITACDGCTTDGYVEQMTTKGVVSATYLVPNSGQPLGIVAGLDGNLWFTDPVNDAIGFVTPGATKSATEYSLPVNQVNDPEFLAVGPDGALWFSDNPPPESDNFASIGRITTATPPVITEYPLGVPSYIEGVTLGPDGALWFAQSNNILRVAIASPVTIAASCPALIGVQGSPYQFTITESGGTAPFTWALNAGPLPPGLTLNAATGLISGTPTATGTYPITVAVTDSSIPAQSANYNCSIVVTVPPPLIITPASPLPSGDVGALYAENLSASGGTGVGYNWSITAGALPNGLSLGSAGSCSGNPCQISGTPKTAGLSSFTVQVSDSIGDTASIVYALTINAAPAITTGSPLPGGTEGVAYSQGVTVSGGTAPFYWALTAGALPAGLSLDSASCPSIPSDAPPLGTSQGGAGRTPRLLNNPRARIKPRQAPPPNVCLIDGTPKATGTSNFTILVQDSYGETNSAQFALTVSPPPPLVITPASPLPSGDVGALYSENLSVSGGTGVGYNWSITAGALPNGLSLGSAGSCSGNPCQISGTPKTAGLSSFTVQVSDSIGDTASIVYALTINAAPAITTGSPLPGGTEGVAYSQGVTVSGGTAPFYWALTAGALPAGLSLDSASCPSIPSDAPPLGTSQGGAGRTPRLLNPRARIKPRQAPPPNVCLIDGTPTATGTSNFTILVQDSYGETNSAQFALTVSPPPPLVITPASPLPSGDVGALYSENLSVSGGTGVGYNWSITAGALPNGLSLGSAGSCSGNPCQISGTPKTAGLSSFTVQVSDSIGDTASIVYALTINAAPAITTGSPLPGGTEGVAYSQGVTVSGGTAPFYWALTAGALPAGLSLDSASCPSIPSDAPPLGTSQGGAGRTPRLLNPRARIKPRQAPPPNVCLIDGTPTTPGTSNFTVLVQDSYGETASAQFSLTVNPPPVITTNSPLPQGTVGVKYSQAVVVSGGTLPLTWTLAAGTLPAGITLNSATGLISGTPTTAGTSSFTIQVTDVNGAPASKLFSLTINPPPAIIGPLPPLQPCTVGVKCSVTPVVSGGTSPYTWTITGALPAGITLNSGTGQISGAPTTAGSFSFTIQVMDANGATASKPFILIINPAPAITTNSLPPGTVGAAYSQIVAASGGTPPLSWAVNGGALPAGLSLNSGTGQISGTPTTAGAPGFTIQVTDLNGAIASKPFTLTINPPPTIVGPMPPLPPCTVGVKCSVTPIVSGGTPPYIWAVTVGALPGGLALNSATGQISGTPTTAGIFSFTIQVTDFNGATASKPLTLTVNPPLVILTNSPLSTGTVGAKYSQPLSASGGSGQYTWTVSGGTLPAGLSLNSATGQIVGTPTAAGTPSFTIQVTDTNQVTAAKAFVVTINPPPAITTASPLPQGTVGAKYSQTLVITGGTLPFTFSVTAGTLPAGVALNSATGQISGTPTTAGSFSFTIQVTDVNQATASKAFALTINPPPSITTASLPTGTLGIYYSATVAASGGTAPLVWTITAGALPAGLTLNSATGQISGGPTAAGSSAVTIQVADANGAAVSKSFTLIISAVPAITTNSPLPGGTIGVAYSQTLTATGGTPPLVWTITAGALPPGLTLNSATGQISGTPTTAGPSTIIVHATDANGASGAKSLTVTISPPLVISTSSALPTATVGVSYSQTLTATGGAAPYTWSIRTGALPAGLSLNSATGQISGTPTAAGLANFTVVVTDSNAATAAKSLALSIVATLKITGPPLPNGEVETSYSQTISLSGGTGPYTYVVSAGALPAGLSLNSASGLITGTPTANGVSNFTVQVTDSNGTKVSQQYTVTINLHVTITTTPLTGGTANVGYAFTFKAAVGTPPYTWAVSAGALPAGITLNSTTGQISGEPKAAGTAHFTIQVTDANGATASAPFTLMIASNPAITTPTLPPPALGSSYSVQLAATGTGPFTWSLSAGSLPGGLTLTSGGLISGTPVAPGTFTFTVLVTNSSNSTASVPFSLTVPQVPLALTIQAPSGMLQPMQQVPITVTLAQKYPVDLNGELVLQFTPNPAAPVVDPAIQFSTGGGSVAFQIPAGQTSPVFSSQLEVQAGTTAGEIVLTASVTTDGVPLTLTNSPGLTLSLPPAVPGIASMSIQQTSSGFSLIIEGYSNTREITQATFAFTPQPGSQIQTTSFTPPGVGAAFQTWYASDASDAYGGQFTYTQPFAITTGSVSTLQSVTVTLTNSQGVSSTMTANF